MFRGHTFDRALSTQVLSTEGLSQFPGHQLSRGHFPHRADEGTPPDPYFGLKFLGVGRGGTLELHGRKKLSWTFLNRTLHPGGMREGGYFFQRSWGHRGVIVHVIDPGSGAVIHSDRY